MIITIASGKGGTGKTTIATNLAVALDRPLTLLDCDVEEPNAHLFLRPEMTERLPFEVGVPEIIEAKCTLCGKCQEICQFNALAVLPQTILIFPELCHSCGGCSLICPEGAVVERRRLMGEVERGRRKQITFVHGRLRVGEAMAPPLIRRVKQEAPSQGLTLIDAPPGTSCPVVTTLWGSDFVILVTEPTPFGLHDLELAVGAARELQLPCGVVINRAELGDRRVHDYARREGLPVLLELPFDRRAAELYARGELPAALLPEWRERLRELAEAVSVHTGRPL